MSDKKKPRPALNLKDIGDVLGDIKGGLDKGKYDREGLANDILMLIVSTEEGQRLTKEFGKRVRKRYDVNPEMNLALTSRAPKGWSRTHLQRLYAAFEDFLTDTIEPSSEYGIRDGDTYEAFGRFLRRWIGAESCPVFGKCEDDKFEDRMLPDDVTLIDAIKQALPKTDLDPELRFEFGRDKYIPEIKRGHHAEEYSPDDPLVMRVHGFPYNNQGWKPDLYFELPLKRTTSNAEQEAIQVCRKLQHTRDLHARVVAPFEEIYKREGIGNSVYVNFDPDNETFYFEKFDVPEKRSVVLDLDKKEWPLHAKSHVFNDKGWDKEALNEAYKQEIEKHIAGFGPLTFDYRFDLDISHRPSLGPLDWYDKEQVKERAKYHEKKYLYGHLIITLNYNSDPAQAVEFYKHMKAIDFNKLKEKVHFG